MLAAGRVIHTPGPSAVKTTTACGHGPLTHSQTHSHTLTCTPSLSLSLLLCHTHTLRVAHTHTHTHTHTHVGHDDGLFPSVKNNEGSRWMLRHIRMSLGLCNYTFECS